MQQSNPRAAGVSITLRRSPSRGAREPSTWSDFKSPQSMPPSGAGTWSERPKSPPRAVAAVKVAAGPRGSASRSCSHRWASSSGPITPRARPPPPPCGVLPGGRIVVVASEEQQMPQRRLEPQRF